MADRDVLASAAVGPASPRRALAWLDRAACGGWASVFDEPEPDGALAVCRRCPVLAECRAWALETAVAGVAGGLTEDDRLVWRTAHGVPEPRVDPSAFLPADVVAADVANEALPDRHLRLVWPPRD